VKARSVDLILVRVFISYFLSLHLADGMSVSISDTIYEIVQFFDLDSLFGTLVYVLFAPFVMTLAFLTLLFAIFCIPTIRRGSLATVGEMVVIALMLWATAVISKQQSDILSTIFNFVGLLLVLDLDELAVKTTSFTLKTANFNTGLVRNQEQVKYATSICFFLGLVIYMLI
jgi:hypothetical protein